MSRVIRSNVDNLNAGCECVECFLREHISGGAFGGDLQVTCNEFRLRFEWQWSLAVIEQKPLSKQKFMKFDDCSPTNIFHFVSVSSLHHYLNHPFSSPLSEPAPAFYYLSLPFIPPPPPILPSVPGWSSKTSVSKKAGTVNGPWP